MVLRAIEQKLERLFEGVFGRAFRTSVQPVELARKLAKEMDEHRNVSVSRVYVPNEYSVYLSSHDRDQFEGYENQLVAELEEYLGEHAQRENYALLTPPRVVFETDDDLGVGEFGIAARVVQPRVARVEEEADGEPDADAAPVAPPAPQAAAGETMVYKPVTQPTEAVSLEELAAEHRVAVLSWSGGRLVVEGQRAVIGRSRDANVQIDDPNVSRRHAELVREGAVFWIVDLGSTNGVEIDGRRVQRAQLEEGTRFVLGETTITFTTEPE